MQAKQSLCTKKASFPSAVAIPVDNIMRCNFGAATIQVPVSSNAFFLWTRPKSLAATRESSLWSGTSIRIEMLHLHGENSTSQTTPYFLRSKLSSNRTWLASHRSEGIRIGIQDVIAPVGSSSALARASVLSDTTRRYARWQNSQTYRNCNSSPKRCRQIRNRSHNSLAHLP